LQSSMTNTSQTKHSFFENHMTSLIAIVGRDLCSISFVIGLLKHDIHTQTLEAAPEFSEIPAGIAFDFTSMTVLN
jgi:hypothetical protein